MASPNLNITHVAAAQNQKEVTINDAIDALDEALTDSITVDFTSGDVTLTGAEFRENVRFLASNHAGGEDLAVPLIKRLFVVENPTSGAGDINVVRGTTSVALSPGGAGLFYTDGTADGLVQVGGTVGGGVPDIVTESTTSRTLALTDAGAYIRTTSGTATTITVPPNSSVAFVVGTSILIRQAAAGQVTIAQGAGVTVNTPETLRARAQDSTICLTKAATDEWDLTGDLEAA